MEKIKIITDECFIPDFSKDVHYISWTPFNPLSTTLYSQLDWVDAIVRHSVSGIDPEEFYRIIDFINETGTLYPKANITIMPSYRQPYSDEEIYRHFNDAMNAQNQYIRAKNVIFDMRNYAYINPYTNEPNNEEYIKMIYWNLFLKSVLGQEINAYVIMPKQCAANISSLYAEFATDAEANDLKNDLK